MKTLVLTLALASAALTGAATVASADPWKDESGHGRWRGGYERYDGYPGRGYGYGRERRFESRERRAFKQEYDDGNCKYERKLEKSGEYKEEVKCRNGRRGGYPAFGYRY